MHISNYSTEQVFTFFIKGDSVTRATATIHAKDLDVAWKRVHALFPGMDLSDTEVQHAGHHPLSKRAVLAQPG